MGTFFYGALFFKISLTSSIQSLKKSSHLKEKSRQSIVKLITNGMAMNCWEFSVIRAIRSQSAQRLHEGHEVVLSVYLDDLRDSVVKKILTSWSL
jgi:predicted amino acid racemase